jgi:phage shock protein A
MIDISDLYHHIEELTDLASDLGDSAASLEGEGQRVSEARSALMESAALVVKASGLVTRAIAHVVAGDGQKASHRQTVEEAIEERPEQVLNALLTSMHDELLGAKKQVAITIADAKRMQRSAENERALAEEWKEKASLADTPELRAPADQRAVSHASLADELEEDAQEQRAIVDQLTAALSRLNGKVESAKREKNLLAARLQRAQAQRTIADTVAGLSTSSAFDVMGQMMARIERMEDEAKAAYEASRAMSRRDDDD